MCWLLYSASEKKRGRKRKIGDCATTIKIPNDVEQCVARKGKDSNAWIFYGGIFFISEHTVWSVVSTEYNAKPTDSTGQSASNQDLIIPNQKTLGIENLTLPNGSKNRKLCL